MRLFLILLTIVSLNLSAQDALESNSFLEIEKMAIAKGKKYGIKNVLVALDIDNTVMQMTSSFGADQWFNWQSASLKSKNCTICVAKNFGELLDIQGQIFAMTPMIPTETVTVPVVKRLQKKGFKVILLTSRGPAFRQSTYRALKSNGFKMKASAIGPTGGYPSTYKPYDIKNVSASGLTAKDVKTATLGKSRNASFQDGVYMTSGMNKGIMLKTLLHKTKSKFKSIIFADDHKKHTVRMQAILGVDKNIDVVTYRYGKIDPIVAKFKKSNKQDSIKKWKMFSKLRNMLK